MRDRQHTYIYVKTWTRIMIPFKEYGFLHHFLYCFLFMVQYCVQYKQKDTYKDSFSLFLYMDHTIIFLPSHYRNWGREKAENIASGVEIRRVKPRESSSLFFLFSSIVSLCVCPFFLWAKSISNLLSAHEWRGLPSHLMRVPSAFSKPLSHLTLVFSKASNGKSWAVH